MKIASNFISWLFVPLLTPVYGMLLAMFVPSSEDAYYQSYNLYELFDEQKWSILYSYFFFCTIVPAIAMLYLKNRGVISSIEIDERKERIIPILVMFMSCLGLYIMFQFLPSNVTISKHIFSYPLAGVITTAVLFIMTLWRKVSLHASGVGIMSGFIVAYGGLQDHFDFWIIPGCILVSGVVMSARLYLHKHTLSEVTIGWFTGAIITFSVSYFL
jgi:membrane-associated phospholipid phosphatase